MLAEPSDQTAPRPTASPFPSEREFDESVVDRCENTTRLSVFARVRKSLVRKPFRLERPAGPRAATANPDFGT